MLGVLLIGLVQVVRDEFDDVLDGVIYGAAIGRLRSGRELPVRGGRDGDALEHDRSSSSSPAGLNHAFYMAVFGAILGWAQRLPPRPAGRGDRARPRDRGLAQRVPRHLPGHPVPAARSAGRRDRARRTTRGGADQLARDPAPSPWSWSWPGDARRGSWSPSWSPRSRPGSSHRRTTRPSPRSAGGWVASARCSAPGRPGGGPPPATAVRPGGRARVPQVAADPAPPTRAPGVPFP